MKKASFLFIMLSSLNICLAQRQAVQDPYSGLMMELGEEKQYLTVSGIKGGSPADLVPLKLGDRIFSINDRNVSEIPDCMELFQNNRDNLMKVGILRIDDSKTYVNINRVSIDLLSNNYYTECELNNLIYPSQVVYVTNWVSQKELFDNLESKVQAFENPQAYKVGIFTTDHKSCHYFIKKNLRSKNQVTVLSDAGKNPSDFKTFDFEYTSADEPLIEKDLLNKLENRFLGSGLKRNSEDPDILIIISFYSGQKEQYVPPQQIVSTKIHSYFNWYWGYLPVPVTESTTKAGYTQVTYLTSINLKFLDARKIEGSKVPPVLWSASYSELSPDKTFLTDIANEVFGVLLMQFPKVLVQNFENYSVKKYSYTGIIYDKNKPCIIADVIPGSPAYEQGLRKGDEITRIEGRKLPENLSNLSMTWNDRSDYENALKYIFKNTEFSNGDPTLFKPLSSDYEGYMSSVGQPIAFSVRKGGKKADLSIVPEYKNTLFFSNAFIGLTID